MKTGPLAVGLLLPLLSSAVASALDGPTIGGKRITFDISNTSTLQYRFNNRNDRPVDPTAPTLNPAETSL